MNLKLNRLLGALLATGMTVLVAPGSAQANLPPSPNLAHSPCWGWGWAWSA